MTPPLSFLSALRLFRPDFLATMTPGGEGRDGAAHGLYQGAFRPGKDRPGRCRHGRGHRRHRVVGGFSRRNAADL